MNAALILPWTRPAPLRTSPTTTLPAHFRGMVVAENYGPSEPYTYVADAAGTPPPALDGAGLITFGSTRYNNSQGAYPTDLATTSPDTFYIDTFEFRDAAAPPPPPPPLEGGVLATSGYFADPDAETWTGTVDYGDGGGVHPLALDPDKTFDRSHAYTADGTYTVTVTVTDGRSGVGSDGIRAAVTDAAPPPPPANRPPLAAADAFVTDEDTPLSLAAAAGVLANDLDPNGDPLTAVLRDGPTHGRLPSTLTARSATRPARTSTGPTTSRTPRATAPSTVIR